MEFDTTKLKPAHLKRIRSLAALTEEQIGRFLPYVEFIQRKANDLIFHEGDEADCLFLILTGRVRILSEKKRRRPYFLRYLDAGESLGEVGLIDGRPRSASAEAFKDCLLLKIDREHFDKLMDEEPVLANQFLLRLCTELGTHLRDLTNRVGNDAQLREIVAFLQ
jgi:CRP/FNR family cyclic AMP-dependent transcriptional regulator